jgi:hypothetical protein
MNNLYWVLAACIVQTGCNSDDVNLEDYFSNSSFECTYENPISVSKTITNFNSDGTFTAVQKVEASRPDEDSKMLMTVAFSGNWQTENVYLSKQIDTFEMKADNDGGEELIRLLQPQSKDFQVDSSVKIKVENMSKYLEVKRTNSCVRVTN